MQEALTVGPLNCIAEPFLSLAELYYICHLLVCFAILCSSWLHSKTPTCSPKSLLGLSKQTAGREENREEEGRGGGERIKI